MKLIASLVLLIWPALSLAALTPGEADDLVSRFRSGVIGETESLVRQVNKLAASSDLSPSPEEKQRRETFVSQLEAEKNQEAYGKLSRIITELPPPGEGADPSAHYRNVLEGITDQLVINRIVTMTHTYLMPMVSADTAQYRESNVVLLNEILDFVNNLNTVRNDFIGEAVKLLLPSLTG